MADEDRQAWAAHPLRDPLGQVPAAGTGFRFGRSAWWHFADPLEPAKNTTESRTVDGSRIDHQGKDADALGMGVPSSNDVDGVVMPWTCSALEGGSELRCEDGHHGDQLRLHDAVEGRCTGKGNRPRRVVRSAPPNRTNVNVDRPAHEAHKPRTVKVPDEVVRSAGTGVVVRVPHDINFQDRRQHGPYRLHVEEADVFRVAGDERTAGLDVFAHQHAEQLVRGRGIIQGDLQQDPVGRIHGGLPQFISPRPL